MDSIDFEPSPSSFLSSPFGEAGVVEATPSGTDVDQSQRETVCLSLQDRIHREYYPPTATRTIPARYHRILQAIRSSRRLPVNTLLEIGPESPASTRFLHESLAVPLGGCVAVDVSNAVVTLFENSGIQALKLDIARDLLPLTDGSQDVVVLSEVIEHLHGADGALTEIRRVLHNEGLLVLTTPNLAAWFNRIILLFGRQPVFTETGGEWVFGREPFAAASRPVGHLQVYTPRALASLLRYHNLRPLSQMGLPLESRAQVPRITRLMDGALAKLPNLAAGQLLVCEKG